MLTDYDKASLCMFNICKHCCKFFVTIVVSSRSILSCNLNTKLQNSSIEPVRKLCSWKQHATKQDSCPMQEWLHGSLSGSFQGVIGYRYLSVCLFVHKKWSIRPHFWRYHYPSLVCKILRKLVETELETSSLLVIFQTLYGLMVKKRYQCSQLPVSPTKQN